MSHRRELRTVVLTCVLAVLVAEAAARVWIPEIDNDLRWPYFELDVKYEQMTELSAQSRAVDVVFVGSSMVAAGMDPVAFGAESGVSAYNAAFTNASMPAIERWTRDVVVPLLQPDLVVVGVSSRELNDAGTGPSQVDELLRESPGYKRHVADYANVALRLEGWLEDMSYLFRVRRTLRDPIAVWRRGTTAAQPVRHGFLGQRLDLASGYEMSADFAREWRIRQLNDYRVGGSALAALVRLDDWLEHRDIELIVVSMPVTDDLLDLHPHGLEDYRAFEGALAEFAADEGRIFIDASAGYQSNALFSDPVHLTQTGQRQFSHLLGRRWDEITATEEGVIVLGSHRNGGEQSATPSTEGR